MDSESDEEYLPLEISVAAQSAISQLIPQKSARQYETAYKEFKEWCSTKKIKKVSENVLLAYFEYKINKVKPPALWSVYSMLKSTLNVKENINITKFSKLIPYLKSKSVGYRPKKSRILTKKEIEKFIHEAPDERFLLLKVILIIGIYGACRRDELLKMTVDDIEDKDSIVIIKIPDSKTHTQRTFVISNLVHIKLYRKYYDLRPMFTSSRRFFIKYINGKCANQVVGINKIRNTPKEIAKYLKLPQPETYTGHCFRRSSATLLADSGADITSLKRHGGWRSATVAEAYIKDSIQNKIEISNKILNEYVSVFEEAPTMTEHHDQSASESGINITNNCNSNYTMVERPEEAVLRNNPASTSGINLSHCHIGTLNVHIAKN